MSFELPMVDSLSAVPATQTDAKGWFAWSDCVGMIASVGCAIHCAAMPFVIAYLPALGLSFLADEAFHQWMAVGCFAIALTAFVPGLRKHGRFTPVMIGSAGLVMISIAAFGFAGECCAACESDSVAMVSENGDPQNSTASGTLVSTSDADECTEACCPHCASESSGADSESLAAGVSADWKASSTAGSQLVGRLVPWMTPVGGLFLVGAHLLNHRFGCLCGCCESDATA